ncbi:hypothetical protein FPCIR_5212 [Fusarium pseudocircinatum]|uniref:Jacalin-type lectin domain-containing protein n=1 Tax=Fusarium pseudocircinatum TaxID=56676 RepID=A0A8H5UQ59_9HYPO|nr:hypothetical protein FPCIR_5212 [Fusarium pseudocircinatum]
MPPIRTEKSNSAADAPAPGTDSPKKRLLKPVAKGVKEARFTNSETDWEGKYHNLIGSSTRTIYFGYAFVLTDDHIDDILVLSRQVRRKIWQFMFNFSDVSYTAENGARDLTNEAVIRLAKGLPNLRNVSLPSANKVGDAGFLSLISNCRDLRLLEITPSSTIHSAYKLGTFERGQRYTGLTKQCQSYYGEHSMHAIACEARAKELFRAVSTIATAQGKTWDQVLGLSGDFNHMIFDGGFEYHGPKSIGKSLSFAQWFFLASLIGLGHDLAGASKLLYYVGCTLGISANSYPVNVRMPVASLFRLDRDRQSSQGLPWARMSRFLRGNGNCNVPIIELELSCGELPYEDSTETIHKLAAMRLDACAHSIMMKAIFETVSDLTSKANKYVEETAAYDGVHFGGFGHNKKSIFLDDDEVITDVSWNTGVLAHDVTKKVIFNLIINTTERKLGPFGTGGDKIKETGEKQVFQVPEKMKVYGLVDAAGKYIEHRGDVIMESGRFIAELRFVVAPAQ